MTPPIYQNALHPNEPVTNFVVDPVSNCWELFCKGALLRGTGRRCLGTRSWESDGPNGEYQWQSYAQIADLAARLTLSISRFCLCLPTLFPSCPGHVGPISLRCLGIYSKNRVEWLIAEQSANIAGLTLVPLYDTFGIEALEFIIRQTKLDTIVVSWDSFPSLLSLLDPNKRIEREQSAQSSSSIGSILRNDEIRSHTNDHLYLRNIILLPPYPCTHPCHLSHSGSSSSPLHSECPISSTCRILTPAPPTEEDLKDASEIPSEQQKHIRQSVPALNTCPDCSLGGRLWATTKLDAAELWRSARRAGVNVIHWADCLQLPTSESSSEIGDLAVSIFPSDFREVWGLNFEVTQLRSISKSDTIQTICYTSVVASAFRGPFAQKNISITEDDCHISYLPLAHIFERVIVNLAMVKGARVGMFGGDVHRLLLDISALQPTVFVSVPRVFTRINDKISAGVKSKSRLSQLLFHVATESKLSNLRRDPSCISHPIWDRSIFSRMTALLGSQIRYLLVGGAPLDPVIQERMTIFFSVPLLQGYGLTEAMGAAFNTSPSDPAGYVGRPFPSVQFKLRSELEYRVSDPHPRGELLLKGPSITSGYFCDEEQTENLFCDGWLLTGDIVEFRLDLGLLKIIDRRKNLFKLVQGEYVAPEKLEGVYQQAALVEQIFVFGYSTMAYLVAVVVPDASAVAEWCRCKGLPDTPLAELCSQKKNGRSAALAAEFHSSVLAVRDVVLTPERFTVENDLLTPTMKLKRHVLLQTFKSDIDEMLLRTDNLIREQCRQ